MIDVAVWGEISVSVNALYKALSNSVETKDQQPELATSVKYNMHIKLILLNNSELGEIKANTITQGHRTD